MTDVTASPFFGVTLSVVAYWLGTKLRGKTGLVVCKPLLVAVVLIFSFGGIANANWDHFVPMFPSGVLPVML